MQRLLIAALLTTASGNASAHARWLLDGKLKPRSNESGLKEPAPCGGAAVDESRRATLVAGETIEFKFEETVQHNGHYRIAFSQDGTAGFDDNVVKDDIPDDQNDSIKNPVETPVDLPPLYHQFSVSAKVPDETCDKCTFQLIQYMDGAGNYYSCADVKIVASGSDTGSASDTGTDTDTATGEKPAAPKQLKVEVKKVGDL